MLELLNIYFDQIVPPIVDAGGEILKFMGDAVLAFFRSDADSATNCSAAFDAALRGLARLDAVALREPELRAGISLHHGTVSYGNIGAGSRLDFTIIGRDVNLVSRIQTVCSVVSQRLLYRLPSLTCLLARTCSRSDSISLRASTSLVSFSPGSEESISRDIAYKNPEKRAY